MTAEELSLLQRANIATGFPDGDPFFVRVRYTGAAVADWRQRGGWQRRGAGEITGWVDNLQPIAGSVMIYGDTEVVALRFWEIANVEIDDVV